MWSPSAILPTFLLSTAIVASILAGISTKGAQGISQPWALARAVLLKVVSSICIIQVLDSVQLTTEWALFTVFELAGVVFSGIMIYGERISLHKALGITFALGGVLCLENTGGEHHPRRVGPGATAKEPFGQADVSACEVLVNIPVTMFVVALVLISIHAYASRSRYARCQGQDSRKMLPMSYDPDGYGENARMWEAAVERQPTCDQEERGDPVTPSVLSCLTLTGLLLLVSASLEIATAYCMKEAHGFRHVSFSILTVVLTIAGTVAYSLAFRYGSLTVMFTLGTAFEYLGVVIVGIVLFGESMDAYRFLAICVTMLGVLFLAMSDD